LVAAHALAALLLVTLLVARAHRHPDTRLRTALGLVVIASAAAAIFTRVHPASLPIGWITMLHEGNSLQVIRNLHGAQAHAGESYRALMNALAASDHPDIRDVVRANLWLAVVAATLVWGIARERSSSRVAAWLAAGLFALNPLSLNATLSELPSLLLAVYMLAALIAAAIALDPELRAARGPAVVLLLLVGALAVSAREEMLALFAPVTLAVAVWLVGGESRVRAIDDALLAGVQRVSARPWLRNLLLAAMVLAVPLAMVLWWKAGALLSWANPLDPHVLSLPLALGECLPWGVIALVVAGAVRLARPPVRMLLLPWALAGLVRIYARTSHASGFEMLRYGSMLLAPVVLLAVEGWRALEDRATARRWPSAWRAPALAALFATWLVPPGIGTSRAWPGEWPDRQLGPDLLLFHRSSQVELRWLMRHVDAEPGCVFIARVAAQGWYDAAAPRWSWVAFGRPVSRLIEAPLERPPLEVVREAAPAAACVRFYRSTDCALHGAGDCAAELQGLRVVDEASLTALPYSDLGEYGTVPPILELGVYELK
jgi:hypothetical protein